MRQVCSCWARCALLPLPGCGSGARLVCCCSMHVLRQPCSVAQASAQSGSGSRTEWLGRPHSLAQAAAQSGSGGRTEWLRRPHSVLSRPARHLPCAARTPALCTSIQTSCLAVAGLRLTQSLECGTVCRRCDPPWPPGRGRGAHDMHGHQPVRRAGLHRACTGALRCRLRTPALGSRGPVPLEHVHRACSQGCTVRIAQGSSLISSCPLQVHAPSLPGHIVSAAERMGGGKAKPALELVGSADHLQAALKYAFGTSLVCEVRADYCSLQCLVRVGRVRMGRLCWVWAQQGMHTCLRPRPALRVVCMRLQGAHTCLWPGRFVQKSCLIVVHATRLPLCGVSTSNISYTTPRAQACLESCRVAMARPCCLTSWLAMPCPMGTRSPCPACP